MAKALSEFAVGEKVTFKGQNGKNPAVVEKIDGDKMILKVSYEKGTLEREVTADQQCKFNNVQKGEMAPHPAKDHPGAKAFSEFAVGEKVTYKGQKDERDGTVKSIEDSVMTLEVSYGGKAGEKKVSREDHMKYNMVRKGA